MQEFYIASVKHTHKAHDYITFWRPEDKGYAWPLSWSGKYNEEQVAEGRAWYHNGEDSIAVPVQVVEKLGVPPKPGMVDNDVGPVVLNTRDNWNTLIAGVLQPPSQAVKLYRL